MRSLKPTVLYLLLPLLCTAAAGLQPALLPSANADVEDEIASPAPRTPHSIAELGWLAGVWTGKGLGGDVEEHWAQPVSGSMMGMTRLVQNDKPGFFEFCLIEEVDGLVTLRFQHFSPGYTPWEKAGPLLLDLIDSTSGRAVFESRDPKQSPARVVYSTRGESGLGVLIESPEALGGPISFEVSYERVL